MISSLFSYHDASPPVVPNEDREVPPVQSMFGKKTIGPSASFALMVNNIIGPGIVSLPLVYREAGWLVPTLALIFAFAASSIASCMTAEAMQRVPGNHRYEQRLEYCDWIAQTVGPLGFGSPTKWRAGIMALYCGCLTCLNIGSIVILAQTVDQLLVFVGGRSVAVQVIPHFAILHETAIVTNCTTLPFSGAGATEAAVSPIVFTLGYFLSAVVLLPMGLMTLEENVAMQYVGCAAFAIFTTFFIVLFALRAEFSSLPMIGERPGSAIAVAMFCYSYAVAIPSWLNEKRPDVPVVRTVWAAALPSTAMQIAFGILGAAAFQDLSGNVLQTLLAHQGPGPGAAATRLAVGVFTALVIGVGIPLYHIYVRYNLMTGGLCSPAAANFWGVLFPWLISWPLYGGNLYQVFLAYSSIIFTTLACYLLPMSMFLLMARGRDPRRDIALLALSDDTDIEEEGRSLPPNDADLVRALPRFLSPYPTACGALGLTTAVLLAAAVLQVIPGI